MLAWQPQQLPHRRRNSPIDSLQKFHRSKQRENRLRKNAQPENSSTTEGQFRVQYQSALTTTARHS